MGYLCGIVFSILFVHNYAYSDGHSSSSHNSQKVEILNKCLSVVTWINEIGYIHSIKRYRTLEKNVNEP